MSNQGADPDSLPFDENVRIQQNNRRRGHAMMMAMFNQHQSMMQFVYLQETEEERGSSSRQSRRRSINRDHFGAHNRLMLDYFVDQPLYSAPEFTTRFRMRRELFLKIMGDIINSDDYFKQKPNAAGKQGLSPYVKMTAALRMLAYRNPADANDDYLKIAESTCLESMKRFCRAVNTLYGNEYLRRPNNADLYRLLRKAQQRGFPGMLGSLDCMHWEWKNCPTAWAGTYAGHYGRPTIILEAVASYDTWIWHSFFGTPGGRNDLNVLYSSPVFSDILEGTAPHIGYTVNGRHYNQGYYLADGIYPRWSTIVQAIPNASERDKMLFNKLQQAYRKDVERAFGILQSRFEIIKGPCRFWHERHIGEIMKTCIILHNMIVEDNREEGGDDLNDDPSLYHVVEPPVEHDRNPITIAEYLNNRRQVTNEGLHYLLRSDLVDHVWNEYRSRNLDV